jgi:hypothetical protein
VEKPKEQTTLDNPPKMQVPSDAAAQIALTLKNWSIPPEHLSEMFEATQRSLETVTHLTEYEDDKANRILTAMAFLSAFAAVIFAIVPSRYPLSFPVMLIRTGLRRDAYLLLGTYGGFVVYAMTLVLGVAFILHGMRPRFNIPKSWKPDGSKPGSQLFFAKIVEVSPADWANSFLNTGKDELLLAYVKNSVLETYLVAEKIVPKIKWLRRGVTLFQVSTIILAMLLPLVITTLALVPEPPERRQKADQQQVVSPDKSGASSQEQVKGHELRLGSQPPVNQTPSGKTK